VIGGRDAILDEHRGAASGSGEFFEEVVAGSGD
jgi:hypothetical protein